MLMNKNIKPKIDSRWSVAELSKAHKSLRMNNCVLISEINY